MEELTPQEIRDLRFHVNQISIILNASGEEILIALTNKDLIDKETAKEITLANLYEEE